MENLPKCNEKSFSVIGNLSLALVTATMSFRIYKSVLAAVNKNQEGHPFKVR